MEFLGWDGAPEKGVAEYEGEKGGIIGLRVQL